MTTQADDTPHSAEDDSWRLFHGDGRVRRYEPDVQDRPAWRRPPAAQEPGQRSPRYLIDPGAADVVTAAVRLSRPLLVTGFPGTGKSSLAESIARELDLGPVLRWAVNSRSTIQDALYRYDAIGRLQESNLRKGRHPQPPDIGHYLRLGPLGTALAPSAKPRVLLIDEFDKGDLDLPNDLLAVFEEGRFEIPELSRFADATSPVSVRTADQGGRVEICGGEVACTHFPVVVITSNGERDFPAAFLRRCVPLHLDPPERDRLKAIVVEHLGPDALATAGDLVEQFLECRERDGLATDQLMNAVFLRMSGARLTAEQLLDAVLHSLNGPTNR